MKMFPFGSALKRSGVRLNVHSATVQSMRRCVKGHRRRLLRAQRLGRRRGRNSDGAPAVFDLEPPGRGVKPNMRNTLSVDELDVGGSSEEDQDYSRASPVERGSEVDSGCDEWDLSKGSAS